MTLRLVGFAFVALIISLSAGYAADSSVAKFSWKTAQAARVCLNCPQGSDVCYPNRCDDKGCHVMGQACVLGGHFTGCPDLPLC